MCIYMYKLEEDLTKHKDDLIEVSFQSDEANTDRPLKEYLKKHIEESFFQFQKIPISLHFVLRELHTQICKT